MSERILKALIQLFSIVADVDGVSGNSRKIVESFLKLQLNAELVEEYLQLYDNFIDEKRKKTDGGKKNKQTSVNSVKVLLICTQINEELTQKQKVVVLLRLLEFIYVGKEPTEQETEFVQTVADTFNIDGEEFLRCISFVKSEQSDIPNDDNYLILTNSEQPQKCECKHITSEGLSGQLRILRLKSVNMYVLKYYGSSELYLNGQVIEPRLIYILTQGSSIRSSKVQPVYYSDIIGTFLSDDTREKITFTVNHLTYRFKTGNIGLHDFNFGEESGHLIGIMGSSGAGKSTLLNLLNGNYMPTGGEVLINSVNIHTEKDKIEGVIGYVSQDDLLIEELSVYENLFYNAKLCFGDYDDDTISKLVLNVLNSIGLYETKDLKVGSPLEKYISGGQRKRLNIALELIREPSVLFVDEPTSGLSSRDSENIMDLLKELALKGKLIFVVIHQPSSEIFKMFDRLLILDTGGYPIYNGNPVDSIIYFKKLINHVNSDESECPHCGNVTPEQVFNIIESKVIDEYGNQTQNRKVSPKEWNSFYIENLEGNDKVKIEDGAPSSNLKIPNVFKQFKVFLTRDVLSKLTNKQYLVINLLEAPVLAFILSFLVRYYNTDASNHLGYIFRENENIPAYIFMCVIVALFIGLTVSAEEIIKDQKILKREKFLNLNRGSYLLSKISVMFFLSAIQTLSFVLVGNTILEIKGMYLDYWLVLFTTACFANMLGLNISASFNSAVTIYILIPFLIIPQLLLSGVIVKFDKLNPSIALQNKVPFSGEIMTSRWAFEALAVNQYKNNKFEKQFYASDRLLKNAEFRKNFWLSRLREKLSSCRNHYRKASKREEVINDLGLIRLELSKELPKIQQIEFQELDKINIVDFDETLAKKLDVLFDELNLYYVRGYNIGNDKKDEQIYMMNQTKEMKTEFIEMKNDYTNESLTDLVTNKNEFNKIVEENGELFQRSNPIYLIPKEFRAQFFAPAKNLFGIYIETFWANVLVIWLMSFTLAVSLYYDLLRNLIQGLGNIGTFLPKKKKK